MTVWVDASSLALGAVLVNGHVVEDGTWLRHDDASHINMAELDAVVKGMNLAIMWNMKKLHLCTDSLTVYHWISDTLTGRARVKTKAFSEMLIRRRLSTLKSLIEEYQLELKVTLVTSGCNLADALTCVPQRWLRMANGQEPPSHEACGAAADSLTAAQIAEIHHTTGHCGVRRTLYFVRKTNPSASRKEVQRVVQACQVCRSVDPASVGWTPGDLSVDETWYRVGMDITHFEGRHYLSLIDCGPSRFAVWRRLRQQNSSAVIESLEAVFFERGAPSELLTDNDTAFRSRMFQNFAERWGIRVRFRCAHAASGNGIVERCHRSVKRIAARKSCPIAEAVYWYNITPKDGADPSTAPANELYSYNLIVYGVDCMPPEEPSGIGSPYQVGDAVWVKPPGNRCDTRFTRGTVSKLMSDVAVEVDGMPRHVRDLRRRTETLSDDDNLAVNANVPLSLSDDNSDSDPELATREARTSSPIRRSPRRSPRVRQPPDRYSP